MHLTTHLQGEGNSAPLIAQNRATVSVRMNVAAPINRIDVLICVGHRDVDRLFRFSLASCLRNFPPLNKVFVATDSKKRVLHHLQSLDLLKGNVVVLDDREVLSPDLYALPGWYRQQVVKLHADQITGTRLVACLGSDTVLLKRTDLDDVVMHDEPILFYNRYPNTTKHLDYERDRVVNVARILGVNPVRSLPLGDFIMDFTIWNAERLASLRDFLSTRHGDHPFSTIIPRNCNSLEDKKEFGEWTLYAVFVLDVLNADLHIRNSNNQFLAQLHTKADFEAFQFDSNIAHFVSKDFDLFRITQRLNSLGF